MARRPQGPQPVAPRRRDAGMRSPTRRPRGARPQDVCRLPPPVDRLPLPPATGDVRAPAARAYRGAATAAARTAPCTARARRAPHRERGPANAYASSPGHSARAATHTASVGVPEQS